MCNSVIPYLFDIIQVGLSESNHYKLMGLGLAVGKRRLSPFIAFVGVRRCHRVGGIFLPLIAQTSE
jgi:hypothetical protein